MSALQVAERSAVYALQEAVTPNAGDAFELLATAPQGVAKLRELILSLALRGKLLPQDHCDEPASKSLARIADARRHLVADGAIKQHKQAGAIARTDKPFELPVGWEWARLADLVAILNGRAYAKDELLDNGVPVLRVGNLFTSSHWYYSNLSLEPDKYCDVGDLLFAWSASFGPFIWPGPKAIYHYHIWKLNLHSDKDLDKLYLHTFLLKKTQEIRAAGHGVSMLHMTKEKMERIVVPVPPLAEQRRIVARVEELMGLCDELEAHGRLQDEQHARLVATLFDALVASTSPAELADNWQRVARHFDLLLDRPEAVDALEQTILQLAVRGLLVPQDPADEPAVTLIRRAAARNGATNGHRKKEGEIGHADSSNVPVLPKGWAWATIDSIASVGTGTTPSRTNPAYFSPPSIPWVTSGETSHSSIARTEQGISPLALRDTSLKLYPIGTLIVAMYGQGKTRGQVSELQIEATTNQACAAIVPATTDVAHRRYLKLFFEKIYDEIRELSAGGAQPNLNVGKVKATLVPLPPLAEQRRIVARVDELRGLCVDLRRHLQQAQATQSHLADALVARAVV